MKRGLIALFAFIALAPCWSDATANSNENGNNAIAKSAEASTVEVLYMHGKQRCVTCVAIGTEAEAVVKELKNSKVVMKTIDISTKEGEKIADKYEVASSSLLVVKGGKVENVTAMSFKYAKNNPELFKKSLNKTIQKMLD